MLITPLTSHIAKDEANTTSTRIIEAFAAKAREVGIRAIVMGELASEIHVSKKTLYKYFRNKEELVRELIVRWENHLYEAAPINDGDVIGLLKRWVTIWVNNDARYSTEFWRELRDEYPELYQHYVKSLLSRMTLMRKKLTPYLNEGMDNQFTWEIYRTLISNAAKPRMFEKLELSREECVSKTLDFWVKSAIDEEKLKNERNK
ncbi:MAG: TetR/AcrR family transcriptional regulator [Cellvibrionaceae bacterium]